MPARLSSLLVRDGVVGVKRMEKAFQRQVIYGGSLDTILLEMNLVPEERLTQYLALASGLPPAARDEGAHVDPAAVAVISRELAARARVVPLALDGDSVRLLVCAPLEIAELEDLADLLDRALQPLITPEYRWHLAYAAAYGGDAPARFTTLARTLDVDAVVHPVGRAKTVIVEDRPGPARGATAAPGAATSAGPTSEAAPGPAALPAAAPGSSARSHDPAPRDRRSTLLGVDPRGIASGPAAAPRVPEGSGPARAAEEPRVVHVPPLEPASSGVPQPMVDAGTGKRVTGPMRLPARLPAAVPADPDQEDGPLTVVAARERFAGAANRDAVFSTLLRVVRSRARWVGLLTVQGGAAIGRLALAEPGLDTTTIHSVLIPLDAMSPFRAVVTSQQPHIGALGTADPQLQAMVRRMGGTMPPSMLLLPIVLRARVIAIVVAHRVHRELTLADVTELLPMAHAASDALGRVIVRHKSAGHPAPIEPPVAEIDPELERTTRIARRDPTWPPPAAHGAAMSPEQGIEVSLAPEPPRPIASIVDDIEQAKDGSAERAIAEALERPREAVAELAQRFPGALRVDRFTAAGRPLRAAQYGGVLELAVRLGAASTELLIEKMAAPQRDVRFYATVCAAELRPAGAVSALAERLFDQDFGVRATAIEALAGYPSHARGGALVRARRAVHSSDPEVVAAAAAAIVELGDVDAIVDLIGVLERHDRAGEHARRALVALTAQDFGASERKWRKWYEGARTRHRIEWLIEGLSHKEDAIREGAINDLRRLTGEYFGYHYDLPRREREAAAARWAAWWREAGVGRFALG